MTLSSFSPNCFQYFSPYGKQKNTNIPMMIPPAPHPRVSICCFTLLLFVSLCFAENKFFSSLPPKTFLSSLAYKPAQQSLLKLVSFIWQLWHLLYRMVRLTDSLLFSVFTVYIFTQLFLKLCMPHYSALIILSALFLLWCLLRLHWSAHFHVFLLFLQGWRILLCI